MEIQTYTPKTLKTIVKATSNLVNEVTLNVNPSEIKIKAIDPVDVAMLELKVPASDSITYEVSEFHELGLDLSQLKRIVKRAKGNDTARIEFTDKSRSTLQLTLTGQSTRRFTLPLIGVEKKELHEPTLDFTATIRIRTKTISDVLKDAELIGDEVRLKATTSKFTVESDSEIGSFDVKLQPNDELELSARGSTIAAFSLDYLRKIISPAPSDEVIELKLGRNIPISVSYHISQNGKARYLLAPRIIE